MAAGLKQAGAAVEHAVQLVDEKVRGLVGVVRGDGCKQVGTADLDVPLGDEDVAAAGRIVVQIDTDSNDAGFVAKQTFDLLVEHRTHGVGDGQADAAKEQLMVNGGRGSTGGVNHSTQNRPEDAGRGSLQCRPWIAERAGGSAAGLLHRQGGQFWRQLVGGVSGEAQFEERNRRHVEAHGAGAAVHQHGHRDGVAAALAHDLKALQHAAAAGHHVLHHEHAFAGGEFEAAAQNQPVVFLFREDIARAGLAGDFLADDEAAHRGRKHGGKIEVPDAAELGEQQFGEAGDGAHVLADLRALEIVPAVQAGTEHEVATQKSARAGENIEDLLLGSVHVARKLPAPGAKSKPKFEPRTRPGFPSAMVIEQAPLEDELGDVLEKALCQADLTPEALARQTGVAAERIRDAIDYRYDFTVAELDCLATGLRLNAAGLRELAGGRYPLPAIAGLPFCLHALRSPHGLGTANAYLLSDCRGGEGVLFDTGPDPVRLRRMWPAGIAKVAAIFLTHVETEHTGGLAEVQRLFGPAPVFAPVGSRVAGAAGLPDGARMECAGFSVETLATPGHVEAHNAYLVRARGAAHAMSLLVGGDLIFAGSVGGGYFCCRRLRAQVARVLDGLPLETVIAPGHGPLTTVDHERKHNPFATGRA